jgi:hypothetical protein
MAKSLASKTESDLKSFTDCTYFINGHCKFNDKCRYRHCREAVTQTNSCFKWPKVCRNVKCPYRHPSSLHKVTTAGKNVPIPEPLMVQPTPSPPRQEGLITFFWDIENRRIWFKRI